MAGKGGLGSMKETYSRSRIDVVGWPDDLRARATLEQYLDKLSAHMSPSLSVDLLLSADNMNFSGADLSGLQLQAAALNESDLRDVRARDSDLYQAWLSSANISRADFSRSDLRKVQASGCIAEGAVFSEAQLQGAVFEDANLRAAVFYGANLHSADFNGADLSRSDLRNCNLGAADFGNSRLVDSMVDGAYGKIFGPIDVGDASGLVSGEELQAWFTARGAGAVEIRNL
jgi:uncharacterized protein YjbI with pentapeptide repeats